MWRWLLAALLVVAIGLVWATGLVAYRHRTGYFAPVFAPDGQSVLALERSTSGVIAGIGYQFWSAPATVYIRRDRHTLVRVGLDGTVSRLAELPPSPLTDSRLSAYHGSIFGSAAAHLRPGQDGVDFETAVTRHDSPLSRTFTLRGRWEPERGRLAATPRWEEASASMGGLEEAQLSGALEVIALPGEEGFPCAIVTLNRDSGEVRTLRATSACAATDGVGLAATVASLSRRAEIERAATVRRTYARLVAGGVAGGLPEGEAMLRAGKEMERLGYYPRSPALTATAASCTDAARLFAISPEEFAAGLFPDIEGAIAAPGEPVDKGMGDYIRHDAYDTSRQLNQFLANPGNVTFLVRTAAGCWRLQITR